MFFNNFDIEISIHFIYTYKVNSKMGFLFSVEEKYL